MQKDDIENLIDCYPNAVIYIETKPDSYNTIKIGKAKSVLPKINLESIKNYQGDSDSFIFLVDPNKSLLI